MYYKGTTGYYVGTEQHARRAPFLILVQSKDRPLGPDNFRALVRKVAMGQVGNFMMGRARVSGKTIVLSGSYGGDGLPVTVSEEIYQKAIPVPRELYDKWNKGEGWNSAGAEAGDMAEWAKKTFN